jgi:hypothetical protein
MSRSKSGRLCRIWSLLLVCLIAISASDDLWTIATMSSSSEARIVADDDPDDAAERIPVCASGSVERANPRSFVRSAAAVVEPTRPDDGYRVRPAPRGPPDGASKERGLAEYVRSRVADLGSAIVFSSPATVANIARRPHSQLLKQPEVFERLTAYPRWPIHA